jgi:hypothetical protein
MALRVAPLPLAGLVALGAINVGLLTQIIGGVIPDGNAAFEKAVWTPKLAKLDDSVAGTKAVATSDQILSRPIFFKTREPFVPRAAPSPTAAKQSSPPVLLDPGLVLGGVMISASKKLAYLFQKSNPNGTWVKEGEHFVGWKLEFIDAGNAKLQKDGRTIELQLYATRP